MLNNKCNECNPALCCMYLLLVQDSWILVSKYALTQACGWLNHFNINHGDGNIWVPQSHHRVLMLIVSLSLQLRTDKALLHVASLLHGSNNTGNVSDGKVGHMFSQTEPTQHRPWRQMNMNAGLTVKRMKKGKEVATLTHPPGAPQQSHPEKALPVSVYQPYKRPKCHTGSRTSCKARSAWR